MPGLKPPKLAANGEPSKYTKIVTEKQKPVNSKEKNKDTIDTEKKKLKVVSEPVWVPVPLVGTKQEIEDRIYVCLPMQYLLDHYN